MQSVSRQKQFALQLLRPTVFDEAKVKLLVRSINFVTDNRVAEMGKMDPDLVRAAGFGECPDNGELAATGSVPNESLFDSEIRHRRRAFFMNHLLEPDVGVPEVPLTRERRVERCCLPLGPSSNDREVFFRDLASFHRATKSPRGRKIFGNEDEPAGFPVEPVHDRDLAAVDQLKGEKFAQRGPKRRRAVRFARMNEEEGRLVDDEIILGFGHDSKFWWNLCARIWSLNWRRGHKY